MEQGQFSQPVQPAPTRRKISFLDLPITVRLRIYGKADVITDRRIYLLSARKGPPVRGFRVDEREVAQNAITRSLLRTCKIVYDEVMALVLARNLLVVLPSELDFGLRFLNRISPSHLGLITKLEIRLQERGRLSHDICPVPGEIKRVKHAVLSDRKVRLWEKVARRLLKRLPAGQTTILFICDLEDIPGREDKPGRNDTHYARAIVRPFRAVPAGTLAACDVRLGIAPSRDLAILAMKASCHASGDVHNPAVRKGVFRFSDLPQEIRRAILEYTDLVTPFCNVNWHPESGFYVNWLLTDGPGNTGGPRMRRHYAPFRFCSAKGAQLGTFCRARHSAFTAGCGCWASPQSLMLVSRAMYEDATAVFYSKNRITVPAKGPDHYSRTKRIEPQAEPTQARLDAALFLNMFKQPSVLRHIRELEFVFPIFDKQIYKFPDDILLCWRKALDRLAENANLTALSLIVHLNVVGRERSRDRGAMVRLGYLETVEQAASHDALPPPSCEIIIGPIATVSEGRLKRFLVFLESEWHYSPNCRCDVLAGHATFDYGTVCRNLMRLELGMEKMVMGKAYDPNKKGEEMGQWLQRAESPYRSYFGGY